MYTCQDDCNIFYINQVIIYLSSKKKITGLIIRTIRLLIKLTFKKNVLVYLASSNHL